MSLYLGSEKVENVMAQITILPAEPSNDLPLANGTANAGVSKKFSRADHVHPKELPNVTDSDNGKFLRVVSGAWAAVEIANANGGSF